jgi:hypothetical protein
VFPAGPQTTQHNPEQAVMGLQARPRVPAFEAGDLLTKEPGFRGPDRRANEATHSRQPGVKE